MRNPPCSHGNPVEGRKGANGPKPVTPRLGYQRDNEPGNLFGVASRAFDNIPQGGPPFPPSIVEKREVPDMKPVRAARCFALEIAAGVSKFLRGELGHASTAFAFAKDLP